MDLFRLILITFLILMFPGRPQGSVSGFDCVSSPHETSQSLVGWLVGWPVPFIPSTAYSVGREEASDSKNVMRSGEVSEIDWKLG